MTVATGIRRPRMQGIPPICLGSTVIRVNRISLASSLRDDHQATRSTFARVVAVPSFHDIILPAASAGPESARPEPGRHQSALESPLDFRPLPNPP
jgi:hypothetical protein